MAQIQTRMRVIKVTESVQQIVNRSHENQWVELTEDNSFFGEMSGKWHEKKKKIMLNRDCIYEIYN